ncbi:helix-turn-helix transcriptional regulator [Catenovulum maritimum]|uniref:HTH araC/xylS-type domain-containing protein n=1 Tax=Catenovulum maritimum TaxID=1513271 RepID=A0A0J8JIE1_9ALTE|nr:AraC family transcriptional regulator [Catenovulum maritimum]KMT64226.1 hypothetical protein XM47_15200 [Catenovulum maritimum]
MNKVEISWHMFTQGVIPFVAAITYLLVLAYFTLIRHKMQAYHHFAIFILCFACFLAGPLINMLPIETANRYFDIARNILLFSFGIPSLLNGLLISAKITLSSQLKRIPYYLGLIWSAIFLISPPLVQIKGSEIPWTNFLIKAEYVYLSQLGFIASVLFIPCLSLVYFLRQKSDNSNQNHKALILCYGVLWLCLCMTVGLIFKQWAWYYSGASVTALVWAWAVYYEIRLDQLKQNQHHTHQNQLARTQFSLNKHCEFSQFYPATLNKSYPYKERESLVEAVNTVSLGLIEPRFDDLVAALSTFCHDNLDTYKIRAKEIAFILFDAALYQGADYEGSMKQLETSGDNIDKANSLAEINQALLKHTHDLVNQLSQQNSQGVDNRIVEQIQACILSHYHKELNLETICEQVGTSRAQAIKLFKQHTGQTINQYLTQVRLDKAKSLLLVKSITETAYEVGFKNPAYFATVFKKQLGMTPSEFQKLAK